MAAESKEYLATVFNSITINSLDAELLTIDSDTYQLQLRVCQRH